MQAAPRPPCYQSLYRERLEVPKTRSSVPFTCWSSRHERTIGEFLKSPSQRGSLVKGQKSRPLSNSPLLALESTDPRYWLPLRGRKIISHPLLTSFSLRCPP